MSEMLKPIATTLVPAALEEGQARRLNRTGNEKDTEKVCRGFESYFILNLLKDMEKTTHISKKDQAQQTYMSIAYEKAADFIAQKGIGIKEMLMRYAARGQAKVFDQTGDNLSK